MKYVYIAMVLLFSVPALAENIGVSGVSNYFCKQLGGSTAGGQCNAPYKPYSGDACDVYEGQNITYQPLREWFSSTTSSCSATAVREAKAKTLTSRASLRGYVSYGSNESVNDPVSNPSYRPGGATVAPGQDYFAAECAIHKCAGGGDSSREQKQSDGDSGTSGSSLPPMESLPHTHPKPHIDKTELFTFRVCNNNQPAPVWVATASHSQMNPDWRVSGWVVVGQHMCANVGYFYRGDFYFFAQTYGTNPVRVYVQSADQREFCVVEPPHNFASFAPSCVGSPRKFSHVDVQGEIFTWNL